uniref:Achaete-scute B n=1 Tax=Malacoceros fuliginosus TaxID=271776 RepID=A0A7G9UKX6_MALFL|nr:achaete-scute B [Malacoceros fuliginosus]
MMHRQQYLSGQSYSESCSYRRSCQQAVTPYQLPQATSPPYTSKMKAHHQQQQRAALQYDGHSPNNPFSPYCRIPLPSPYGDDPCGVVAPAFIRKRNERERERVRCVNDGYARLREHVPLANKDKRVSKVETLRAAINYIEHLQEVLHNVDGKNSSGSLSTSIKQEKHSQKRNELDIDFDSS